MREYSVYANEEFVRRGLKDMAEIYGKTAKIAAWGDDIVFFDIKEQNSDIIFAKIIAGIIIDCYFPVIAGKYVRKEYFFLTEEKKSAIIMKIIKDFMCAHSSRRNLYAKNIAGRVEKILASGNHIDLWGIINFRLKDYKAMWEAKVDREIDELLYQEEKREYIEAISYYIKTLPPSDRKFAVIKKDLRYLVFDEVSKEVTYFYLENELLAFLVESLPARIKYCGEKGDKIFNIIKELFGKRVDFVDKYI